MIGRIPRWFLIVGIVTAPLGCDNVSWGGMSVSLQGPPGDSTGNPSAGGPGEEAPPRIEVGPLLFAGVREGDSAIVQPVGEIVEGSLAPLPGGPDGERLTEQLLRESLVPGRRFALFHGGSRVGTLTLSGRGELSRDYCTPRPRAAGRLELLPSASEVARFLAMAETEGPEPSYESVEPLVPERLHRNAAQNLAGRALNELQAPWPRTLQDIRRDLQVFRLEGSRETAVAATFTFRDQLEVGTPEEGAYALFLLGEGDGSGFRRTFTWYRPVAEGGKGAPRLFSWMDWDGDGMDEILLEVFGVDTRWWAALSRNQEGWSTVFQEPCGTPTSSRDTTRTTG